MGASNHPTVVPAQRSATAANPYRKYSDGQLRRTYRETARRLESGGGGAHLRAAKFALAHELARRDMAVPAPRDA